MAAPILEHDVQRVAVLHRYGLLDTPPEREYDDLARLAALVCQAPIGLITLVDSNRQWFKARYAFDIAETPRDISFCAHTIAHDDVLVVQDACNDPRFADNPLVTGGPQIRFYAGVPLKSPEGAALGALAVIDRVPRTLAPEHRNALVMLALQVQDRIEDHQRSLKVSGALADSEGLFQLLTKTTTDAVLVLDGIRMIRFANPAVAVLFGHEPESLVNRSINILQPERLHESHRRGVARYLATGERRIDWRATETTGLHRDGHEFPIEITFSHLRSGSNDLFAGFIRDLSARKAAEAAIRQSEGRFKTLVEAGGVGIWQLDRNRSSVYMNPAMMALLEVEQDADLDGRGFRDFLTPESRGVADQEYLKRARGEASSYEVEVVGNRGTKRQLMVSGAPLQDSTGAWIGTIGTLVDISELRKSLAEKEALLREVHHRVKNNLQVINSLLRLEAARTSSHETRGVLKEMQGRILSMALLHEALYRTGNFHRVDLAAYLSQLAAHLFRSHNAQPSEVRLVLNLMTAEVNFDQAIPCGLIVNELLTNSLKHGFPEGVTGEARLSLTVELDRAVLEVTDTGAGLAADFEARRTKSLGLQLVGDLARQIQGEFRVAPGPVARFTVTFPLTTRNRSRDPL